MPKNENEQELTNYILEQYDNADPKYLEDCTHRNLFDIFDDHRCQPCKCGSPNCKGMKVEFYCMPSPWLGMSMEFKKDSQITFDESGLPLTENPEPLHPFDELILNG